MIHPPVYILRHGQTEWNAEHRIQGSLDSVLTPNGRLEAQMQHSILKLQDLSGATAFSSPQGRAFHTAAIALNGLVSRITTDERLCEIGVGSWEGVLRYDLPKVSEVDESEESALALYADAPEGEGFAALRARCKAFLTELDGPSIVVTHGITSRMLRLILLDLDTCEIGAMPGGQGVVYRVENGVQTKLSIRA